MNIQDVIARWGEASPDQVVARASQVLPFWVSVLAVLAIAWYLARLAWLLYPMPDTLDWQAPPAPAQRAAAPEAARDYATLAGAHLFGEAGAEPAPVLQDDIDAPETRLNLALRATVAAAEAELAHAIIADGSGNEKVYFIGASVPGGASLHQVYMDRVILNRGGSLEALRLPRDYDAPAASGRSASRRAVSTPTVAQVVEENAATLLEVVRPQPFMPDGQMRGYRVYPGRNRQQFAQLGLRPGDLITEINGMALNNPAEGMQIFQNIASATQVSVTLERAGEQQVLTLDTSQLGAGGNLQ